MVFQHKLQSKKLDWTDSSMGKLHGLVAGGLFEPQQLQIGPVPPGEISKHIYKIKKKRINKTYTAFGYDTAQFEKAHTLA